MGRKNTGVSTTFKPTAEELPTEIDGFNGTDSLHFCFEDIFKVVLALLVLTPLLTLCSGTKICSFGCNMALNANCLRLLKGINTWEVVSSSWILAQMWTKKHIWKRHLVCCTTLFSLVNLSHEKKKYAVDGFEFRLTSPVLVVFI